MSDNHHPNTRAGMVALIGRPNVGKSTLLNKLVGQKISITTPHVQTTRHKILGVLTDVDRDFQIVFIDVPGICNAYDDLGRLCNSISLNAASDADIVLFIMDSRKQAGSTDIKIAKALSAEHLRKKVVVAYNKIDRLASLPAQLPLEELSQTSDIENFDFNSWPSLGISAKEGTNLDDLLETIVQRLPFSPFYYPQEMPTDRNVRMLASEFIRESAMTALKDELPHALTVTVQEFVEAEALTTIKANLIVNSESQKRIAIGAQGSMIKKIGTIARRQIEDMLEAKVMLKLNVKVNPGWRNNSNTLKNLGYSPE